MGWARKAPKHASKHGTGRYLNEVMTNLNIDKMGNYKKDWWSTTWRTSREDTRWAKRYTNRQRRACGKIHIQLGLQEVELILEEWWEDYADENWYDDEPMDYPEEDEPEDFWYDPYYQDDFYYDSWDYEPDWHLPREETFEHEDHPSYQEERDRYMNDPCGKSLSEIIHEIRNNKG